MTHIYIYIDCGQPSVPQGTFVAPNGTTLGQIAVVSCIDGYNLNGSSTIVCTATGWNETVTCDIQSEYAHKTVIFLQAL